MARKLEDFPFPILGTPEELCDYELQYRLPLRLFLRHEGHKININGTNYILLTETDEELKPRDFLTLKVDKYFGRHFYGNLKLPRIEFKGGIFESGRSGTDLPKSLQKVNLTRLLAPEEIIAEEKIIRAELCIKRSQRFQNAQRLVERAKRVTRVYFPGFKLEIEDRT